MPRALPTKSAASRPTWSGKSTLRPPASMIVAAIAVATDKTKMAMERQREYKCMKIAAGIKSYRYVSTDISAIRPRLKEKRCGAAGKTFAGAWAWSSPATRGPMPYSRVASLVSNHIGIRIKALCRGEHRDFVQRPCDSSLARSEPFRGAIKFAGKTSDAIRLSTIWWMTGRRRPAFSTSRASLKTLSGGPSAMIFP